MKHCDKQVLWTDKKRFMGMPISFTRYSVDEERMYLKSGFFKTELDEILLYRVLDVKTKRNLWQKIFGVGTVVLYSADQSNRVLELKNVKKPYDVHHFISELVEKRRRERGIVGREMVGSGAFDADSIDHICGDDNNNGIPDSLE